jgi:two-component system KDP operon response regulator KdpE
MKAQNGMTALVIDDEKQMRSLVRLVLEGERYRVFESETGADGLRAIIAWKPDVIILDLGLPDLGGHQVLERLREWSSTPVLVLSVRDSAEEKVKALDLGADDYVTKPFGSEELLARLRAIQRRTLRTTDEPVFEAGELRIDFTAHLVEVRGKPVKLTATEFALLKILARHAGKVITQRQLLREIWGPQAETQAQYLRLYVTYLRRKLALQHNPRIETEPRIGYRLAYD